MEDGIPRPTWRETAIELAGPEAVIRENVPDGWGGVIALAVVVPGAAFNVVASEPGDDPWRRLAYHLADRRLVQSLERAGWVVDMVIDETTYVVAQEPDGTIWAIGVAAADDDRRWYLEIDMADESHAERLALVDPIDTRSPDDLLAALGLGDR